MRRKAIALLSGGLDSILATRLILEQNIEVEALNFLTVFCTCTSKGSSCLASKSAADQLGVKLRVFEISREYLDIVKHPKYGYGSNINPCLDCRILIFKKAAQYMKETSASFIITGEVLGERPMSQRRDAMRIIERESGLDGLVLRPLSAKLMEPTIPEKEGLVDREKLFSIRGRSRKPQIQLAKNLNIRNYPCPSGGCLLTDPGFARRMRDLLTYKPDFDVLDIKLIKTGRYFRISENAMLVIGRNQSENEMLKNIYKKGDIVLSPVDTKGPLGIGRGDFTQKDILLSCRILARYCDKSSGSESVKIKIKNIQDVIKYVNVLSAPESELAVIRV